MSPNTPTILIRDSAEADLPAIKTIYAHHVEHGTASFELDPPPSRKCARAARACWKR